ncbi:MAG: hypothetical protein GX567_07015 [Clostridia bacterium]|nr:hypothetical protein [Clostridia bacterium]
MQILTWIIIVISAVAGGLSSIILILSFPAILVWKFYRLCRYRISMFN